MNAIDRRILHLALKNDRHVTTKSVGEGANRKVVVVPRDYDGDVEQAARDSGDERAMERGGRGPRRGGRGRPRSGGGFDRQASGRRSPGAKAGRTRPIPPGRMHDSFDVPSVPEDMFESDEDLMTLAEEGIEAGTEPVVEEETPHTAEPEHKEEER